MADITVMTQFEQGGSTSRFNLNIPLSSFRGGTVYVPYSIFLSLGSWLNRFASFIPVSSWAST